MMTREMDLWSRNVALSYALLRIALGLNICLHGIVRWASALETLPNPFYPCSRRPLCPRGPSTPSATCCQSSKQIVGACVLFGFETWRALLRLGPHAFPEFRVCLATRLADGGNPAHLFRRLFPIARGNPIRFLLRRPASSSQVSAESRITSAAAHREAPDCRWVHSVLAGAPILWGARFRPNAR